MCGDACFCTHDHVLLIELKPSIERFSKPNFGSFRRFRTMTGLEIENWIEKRGRTVRKFRSTRPRTESNFRFGLTSCRSQNLPSEVRSLLCQVFDSFSLVTSSSSHHASHLRGFIRSLTRPNWSFHSTWLTTSFFFLLRQEIFGRYMVIISEWMGKICWPWDHQWSRTWQESPGLAQFDKEHFFGTQGPPFSTARHQVQQDTRAAALGMQSYGRSYFCLLNVIFGCVSTEISIQFSTRPVPNRIEYSVC